ncbi:MAG: hypothetical protein HYT85_11290 [candidate division NC10 bacterium]|nr:hypothetical protein [candidate division NC10 bacterium]
MARVFDEVFQGDAQFCQGFLRRTDVTPMGVGTQRRQQVEYLARLFLNL